MLKSRSSSSVYGWILAGVLALGLVGCGTPRTTAEVHLQDEIKEDDTEAPIDLGMNAGLGVQSFSPAVVRTSPTAHLEGAFSEPVQWPIIAVHAVLTPDGKVLTYGTGTDGAQGAKLFYSVWNPAQGLGLDAHSVLANSTSTDIFCSAQAVVPQTGQVVITGGDWVVNGKRNFSNADINFYDYRDLSLTKSETPMTWRRWYPSVTTLASGEVMVSGGREEPNKPVLTPEVYTPGQGWRTLPGATNSELFSNSWFYPRAFQAPNGKVFYLAHSGRMYYLDPSGNGSVARATTLNAPGGRTSNPIAMFAPGKILAIRGDTRTIVVNLNGSAPTFANTSPTSQRRDLANLTVMADGRVLLTGGSAQNNVLEGVAYHAEIWNPASGTWTRGASAQKPRLYHSTSLLLPDATVLTAGGGAPGPVKNLNAEIYYPPYLFKTDGSGEFAERPGIVSAPQTLNWGQSFGVGVSTLISRVTLVRTGSVTHSWDMDQRFMELSFTQSGESLEVAAPASANVAPPGYYMLFVFDPNGVPSVAKIVKLAQPVPADPLATN